MEPDDPRRTDRSEEQRRARVACIWLFAVAGLVFLTLVVGGATRLTQSGLSMVRWEPVSGMVPPLSDADWQREFQAYQDHPEYQLVNVGMDLDEFKVIFMWEYLHRVLGRLVGLALMVPLAWLALTRRLPSGLGRRLVALVVLVGLQGAIGWWMVTSGLVDRPEVAHERLALHLVTALALLVALLWTALDLAERAAGGPSTAGRPAPAGRPARWVWPFAGLLTVQIVLGAFVAGLDAGRIMTTWPTMAGAWVPDGLGELEPVWANVVDNPVAVQFAHRWLAWVVAASSVAVAFRLYRMGATRLAVVMECVVAAQVVLGVFTLVHAVPTALGVAHQAGAALLVSVTVFAAHRSRGPALSST